MAKSLLLFALISIAHAQLDMNSDKMGYEDNIAEESQSIEKYFPNSVVAKPILNDGKPFYVARDPTTGNLDFSIKKTVGLQNDIPINRKDEIAGGSKDHDIILSNAIPQNNIHDYLPVKYSSSKFVYPLISGSYANLKYQGNNKNQVSNHKNYTTTLGTTTMSPKYFTHITSPVKNSFATFQTREPVIKLTTSRQTTEKPLSSSESITKSTTAAPSTVKYSSTILQQDSFPSTFKNKYVDSSETRRKTTPATTSTTTRAPESTTLPANPIKFIDELLELVEKKDKEMKPTTFRPQIDGSRLSFATSMPLAPSAFKPMPTNAPLQSQSNKIRFESGTNPSETMSLSEIFNSITGNENLSNEQNSISYEASESSQIEDKKQLPTISTTTEAPKTAKTTQQAPVTHQKTLQQHYQNQPFTSGPQYVDLPVHQPLNFAPPVSSHGHVGFPVEDYVEFENPDDHYVKYEVQKPNVNLVKFQQIPSMNNVVISPGQNSASFVLGSQQSVGSVGIGSSMGVGTSNFVNNNNNNGPLKVGQVINDEPPVRSASKPVSNQIQASIRFPNDAEQSFANAQIVKGTIKLDGPSEAVIPPQALAQNQPPTQKPLVFPSNEYQLGPDVMNAELSIGMPAPAPSHPSHVIFENVNDIYEKINKKQKLEIASNELSGNIPAGDFTPPRVLTPPSQHQNRPFNNRPPQFHLQRRPQGPQRIPGLPNILPQFRPNAKASQGHPPIYKDVGAIRVQQQGPFNRHYPSSPVPQPKVGLPPMMGQQQQMQNLRRTQNPPNRQLVRINGQNQQIPSQNQQFEQSFDTGNRRLFRVPPPSMNDRTYMKAPQLPSLAPPVNFHFKRPQNGVPETMQMQQRPSSSVPQYQDTELNKSSPPALQPLTSKPDITDDSNSTKLEPVVTLQMLQSKKGTTNKLNLPPVPYDIPQDLHLTLPKNHKEEPNQKPSIYVVYPVAGNSFETQAPSQISESKEDTPVIVGNRGESIAGMPSEYQNTPFSVVSHFEQEPLLMTKDKKKNHFPYHIERPNVPIEIKNERPLYGKNSDGSIYNIGEELPANSRIIKRPSEGPISSKLTRVTDKPIALAYTPTEPNRQYPTANNYYSNLHPHHYYTQQYDPHLDDKYSVPNYGGPVISEILDEKHVNYDYYHRQQQLHQPLNNDQDVDFHKEHYDFQAPFHASVSLSPEVTNPYEGWSVITQSTDTNKIDRSDDGHHSEESSTKTFDPNEFQPIFESGFQPIYSSKRVNTVPELGSGESSEIPSSIALALSTQALSTSTSPASSIETSPETRSSEETSSTHKPQKKFEIDSLEAFFDSLTRDYDEDESTNKSDNESMSL